MNPECKAIAARIAQLQQQMATRHPFLDGRGPGQAQLEAELRALSQRQLELGCFDDKPRLSPLADVNVDEWRSIGPSRIDDGSLGAIGRLSSIAIHPKAPLTMYVGGESCGLWNTSDGGATWAPIDEGLPTLAIGGIAIDPVTPSRVYVVAVGAGVYCSSQGGAPNTWVKLSDDLNARVRWGVLLIDPVNPVHLYLTSSEGVYRSPDAGTNWYLCKSGGKATGLVLVPSNPNTLYVAVHGDGIYKTTTGGRGGDNDWTKLTAGLPGYGFDQITLALCGASSGTVYAGVSSSSNSELNIYRTTDDGASWTLRSTLNSPPDVFNDVIGVDQDDPSIVYATGVHFYRSTDGGLSFEELSGPHDDHHAFARDQLTPGTIYALSDGGIFRSLDRGDTWALFGAGISNVQFYDLAVAATNPCVAVGGTQDNGNLQYDGTSTIWRRLPDGNGDGATVDIDPTNAQILYTTGQHLAQGPGRRGLARSTDGGANFSSIAANLPTCPEQNEHFQVDPRRPTTLLASCTSLRRTTSPGDDWSTIFTPAGSDSIVRCAVDPVVNVYYAGTSGGRLYAGSNGTDFTEVFNHPNGSRVKDICIDPHNVATSIVYMTFDGGGGGRLYRLVRSGPTPATMNAIDITANLPPGLTAHTIAVDRIVSQTLFVGTDRGVYKGVSTDSGATWSWVPYNSGLPLAGVRRLVVHPATGIMRAATYGRSAYEVVTTDRVVVGMRHLAVSVNENGGLEAFYTGTDGAIYHSWQAAANDYWHGTRVLGGAAKRLAIARNNDGRLEVFYIGTNDVLYHNWQTAPNGGWAGEAPLQGQAKQLSVARNADGRLEVFYVGTDDLLYHTQQTVPNGGWAGEKELGGEAKQIAVGRNADGRLEVFYVGTNDDLYHNWQTAPGGDWAGEGALDGQAKQIAVGRNANGNLELFYVGTNNHLYHNWQTSVGWAGEAALQGQAKQLTVGSNEDGRLELFYIGINDVLYHNWQKWTGEWVGEVVLQGQAKQLTVVSNTDGRLEVFYIGVDDALYHNWQTEPNGGWAGEAGLGPSHINTPPLIAELGQVAILPV